MKFFGILSTLSLLLIGTLFGGGQKPPPALILQKRSEILEAALLEKIRRLSEENADLKKVLGDPPKVETQTPAGPSTKTTPLPSVDRIAVLHEKLRRLENEKTELARRVAAKETVK